MKERKGISIGWRMGAGLLVVCGVLAAGNAEVPAQLAESSHPGVIRYGLTAAGIGEDVNPNDAAAASLIWARETARQVGQWSSAESEVIEGPDAAVRAIGSGRVDLLIMSALEFLSVENQLPAVPAMTYEMLGSTMTEYVLLTKRPAGNVADLSGKRLVMQDATNKWNPVSTWLDVTLAEAGLPGPDKAFSAIRSVPKSGQSAMAVFFGQADAAIESRTAFQTAVELNPQLGTALKVLAQSPPMLRGVISFRATMPAHLRQRYVEMATRMHEQPGNRQTFLVLRLNRLVEFKPSMLDSVRALVKRQRELRRGAGR